MSAPPPPYTQRGSTGNGEPRENCRDYLRTGRCKYGASCKYRHPANVQSGGGMKTPVDPSEPMFPIRPNEPVCQYYMKHGTCKFGQACKFHHPPQSSVTAALVGGGAVVMNMGGKSDVPQIVVKSISGDGATPMMLQFLPQRPEEQDCIFFLKNGRCKYGATCRYHHPINFNQRLDDSRRQRVQVQEGFMQHTNLQFISQTPHDHGNYQPGPPASLGGSHVIVSDAPVAFTTADGPGGKGPYHPLTVVNAEGYCVPAGALVSHNQDHTSSTSSIASSYDTANSNLDHFVSQTEQSSGFWKRQKINGSSSAYDGNGRPQRGTRIGNPQGLSDGSDTPRRHRAASYGSVGDSVYVDVASLGRAASSGAGTLSSGNSTGSMPGWCNERQPSYENVRRVGNQRRPCGDMSCGSSHHEESRSKHRAQHGQGTAMGQRTRAQRLPSGTGRRRSSQAVDDGLSMMTSALLTMLDTPEEAAADGYEFENEATQLHCANHNHSTDIASMSDVMVPRRNDLKCLESAEKDSRSFKSDICVIDDKALCGPVIESALESQKGQPQSRHTDAGNWLPNQQRFNWVGRPFDGHSQPMLMIPPRPTSSSNSPHGSSDMSLFLP